MATLSGKAALAWRQRLRQQAECRAAALTSARAHARAQAYTHGKQLFDMAVLDTLYHTGTDPEPAALYENLYYVEHAEVRTLAHFAALINRLAAWS